MARESKPAPPIPDEKPLPVPDNRPGTSGTEALLVTNRRRASENYQRAHRAEKAYRAKKRASAARGDFQSAKDHYREAWSHLKQGLAMSLAVVRGAPYLLGEKREQRRINGEENKRKKALDRKKRLEEKLARESEEVDEKDEAEKKKDGENKDGEEERKGKTESK
jgi:hypothetical protein